VNVEWKRKCLDKAFELLDLVEASCWLELEAVREYFCEQIFLSDSCGESGSVGANDLHFVCTGVNDIM
jgi:hypothetical protein